MAAPTVRATTKLTGASGTSAIVSKPTGTADGDIIYVPLYTETQNAITAPSGWTLEATCNLTATADKYAFRVYSKRAASEGTSWTWSWTGSVWREAQAIAVQGAVASGAYADATATSAVRDTTAAQTIPSVSITTVTADVLVLWFCGDYIGANNSSDPPTGFTAVLMGTAGGNEDVLSAKLAQATAGTVTASGADYGTTLNGPTNAILVACRSTAPASSYSVAHGFTFVPF